MQSNLPILDYETRASRRSALPVLTISLVIAATLVSLALTKTSESGGATRHTGPTATSTLLVALHVFELDNGRYPTTGEGLDALVKCPRVLDRTWRGPYIESVPVDEWGSAYRYSGPDPTDTASYDLHSAGPDRVDGTADDVRVFLFLR